jgi:hypothetical protein
MSTQDNHQLDELQALVIRLGDAVASNERRSARLERIIRWGLLGGLAALVIALAITLKPLNDAFAQQGALVSTDVQGLVNALNGIKGSLDNLNVVGMMQMAAVKHAKLEAHKMVKEAPQVSKQVVAAEPDRQPKGKPMGVTCGRMTQAGDIAMQQLKARYPLGASALAYFCQRYPDLGQQTVMDEETLNRFGNEAYQQAAMAGTLRTMTNAAGLVNNLHEVTTMFGELMQSVWARVLEKTKDEVHTIVVTSKLPDYCQILASSQMLDLKKEVNRLTIEFPLGSYVLGYLCRTYPGISDLDEETLREIWAMHRDEYQEVLMHASADTMVDMGTLVFRLREDSDRFRRFLLDPPPGVSLEGIRHQLDLLNETLASVPVMTASVKAMTHQMGVMNHQMGVMSANMGSMTHSMGSSMGRMGSWMPW